MNIFDATKKVNINRCTYLPNSAHDALVDWRYISVHLRSHLHLHQHSFFVENIYNFISGMSKLAGNPYNKWRNKERSHTHTHTHTCTYKESKQLVWNHNGHAQTLCFLNTSNVTCIRDHITIFIGLQGIIKCSLLLENSHVKFIR